MPFTPSPYIDGNTSPQNRAIWVEGGLHFTGIYPSETLLDNTRLKVVPDRYYRNLLSASIGTAYTEAIRLDVATQRFVFMRVENASGGALNDFIIDVTAHMESSGGFWEEIANGDYFFTNGTGEAEGNAMKLVRKVSPVNPRTLAANGSTWLALNVEYVAGIRIRARAAANTTLTFRVHQTYS